MRQKQRNALEKCKTDATFAVWFQYFMNLLIMRFEWKNLPPTIDVQFMERHLITNQGWGVLFRDEILGSDLFLPATANGHFDIYGIPTNYKAFAAYNGYQVNLNNANSVIVWNNFTHTNEYIVCEYYADMCTRIQRAADVNLSSLRTPLIFATTDSRKFSADRLMRQYDENHPFITVDKDLTTNDSIKAIQTGTPYLLDKFLIDINKVVNMFCTMTGINNANTEKKERLITEEAQSNNEQIGLVLSSGLISRQKACEAYNRMYGTNFWVEARQSSVSLDYDIKEQEVEKLTSDYEEEVEYDG